MKLKKEYIILFTVIAALVLYIALRKGNRIQYEIPEVSEIIGSDISGIVIEESGKKLALVRENDRWVIEPEKYTADSYKVEKMLDFLSAPELVTVVSDSKDYMRYGLDDKKKLSVKAVSEGSNARSVEIGYQTEIRDFTFLKLENGDRVFHARGDLRDIFTTDMNEIRDKTVISFESKDIGYIELIKDGKKLSLTRTGTEQIEGDTQPSYEWKNAEGKTVDNAAAAAILNDILEIKCSEYIYDNSEVQGDPMYVIKVTDEKEHSIKIFTQKENEYSAVSSDNPTPFKLYAWRIDNIIEKFDGISGE